MINIYAKVIYEKPITTNKRNIIDIIKNRIKLKRYKIKYVDPLIQEIKYGNLSYNLLCSFSDFIRILEMVYFYHNDAVADSNRSIKLLSDNKLNEYEDESINKSIILVLKEEKVIVSYTMSKSYNTLADSNDTNTIIKIENKFGKKLTTEFMIVNGEYDESINEHQSVLLSKIDSLIRDAMVNLFIEYYNKA